MSDSDSSNSTSLQSIHAILKDMAKNNKENSSCLKDLTKRVTLIEKDSGRSHKRKTEVIPSNRECEQPKKMLQSHEIVVDVHNQGDFSFVLINTIK